MKPKFIATFALAVSLTTTISGTAQATPSELNLACIAETPNAPAGFITRQILVGQERKVVTLKDSKGREVSTRKYAVLIEIIPGVGGNGLATEEWEILTGDEFTIRPGSDGQFFFQDLKSRTDYVCDWNRVSHANPALTRTN